MDLEIGSEDDLRLAIDRINTLFSRSFPFGATRAMKDYQDLFGQPIAKGETYYKRDYGGFGDDLKLSKASMHRVCFAVLFANDSLCSRADDVLKERKEELADLMRRME